MEFVLLWLLCGVACGMIAQSKRHGFFGNFIGGLLLGPIWLIVVAASQPGGTPCPKCRSRNDPTATICPHCQADLTEPSPKKRTGAPAATVEKACSACFAKIDARATRCRFCTAEQVAPEARLCSACGAAVGANTRSCPKCETAIGA